MDGCIYAFKLGYRHRASLVQTLKMMNPAFAEMHGYVVGELLDKPIVDVFAPESRGDAEVMIKIANETVYQRPIKTYQKRWNSFSSSH